MTTINPIENQVSEDLVQHSVNVITKSINEAGSMLFTASTEKYKHKNKLISEAKDMSTQDKLDALDQNYARHHQEIFQDIIEFSTVSLAIAGAIIGGSAIIKGVRQHAA